MLGERGKSTRMGYYGGRVGKSSHGAELLSSEDPQKTYKIAIDLENSNKERQTIESILSGKINSLVENYHNPE